MEIKIDVSRFQDDLKRLNFSDKKPALTKALLKAVEPTLELARTLAPVDTGRLSRSMTAAEDKKNRDPELVIVKFGATVPHWLWQEFGTAHHAAQPFTQPAIDRSTDEIEDRLVDALNIEIQKLLV